ncbi:MAG: AAA family ATPase [bacterium]
MKLQVGYDDFGNVRVNNLQFVDKTLFIKEILDNNNISVSVITRPRRFGKTFNLSTLRHFLAPEVNQTKTDGMFDGLKIATVDNGNYMQYQGKYPVIFISFKEIKSERYDLTYSKLCALIANVFDEHNYLKQSDKLTAKDKQVLQLIVDEKADQAKIENSLYFLTSVLFKHHGVKPWLLIDEYDTPIQSGYLHNYYGEIIGLMRGMFGAALKTNSYLNRAVVTGILRIAKESIFSELNNITVYSLLQSQYGQHFGFTEEDVHELLVRTKLENQKTEIRKWYNGYVFGGTTVYNPWSIVNYINNQIFKAYWVNTSDNQLIKDQLIQSSTEFKEEFKLLLQDKTLEKIVDENMVFGDLKNNNDAAWSLLLMSGYLKPVSIAIDIKGKTICRLTIPNWEVKVLYCDIIEEWLGNGRGIMWYQNFLSYLLDGNVEKFVESFGEVLIRTISVYDLAHNPEAFYHGFMLGLAAGINQEQYEIKSNRESGLGRYDIAIIPKDVSKLAIILEIKSISPPKVPEKNFPKVLDSLLTRESKKALEQINRNQYSVDLAHRGIANIVKIGLAFSGKEFRVASEVPN